MYIFYCAQFFDEMLSNVSNFIFSSTGGRSNALPSVTNREYSLLFFSKILFLADGLREDTVFVSRLPQNIDHDIMKSHFGVIGKIKVTRL